MSVFLFDYLAVETLFRNLCQHRITDLLHGMLAMQQGFT